MPFFPNSIWGLIYLGALVVTGLITLRGPDHKAWRILAVLAVHWLLLRTIDVYDPKNFILWLVHDYVFFGLLLLCRGGLAARACAGWFLVIVAFDSYSYATNGTFEGASAVAEIVGIVCMAIMAGSAHGGTDGKLARHSDPVRAGIGGVLYLCKSWRQAWGHARSNSGLSP